MSNVTLLQLVLGTLFVFAGVTAVAEDRSKIPEKYTWDLTHLYPSPEAWQTSRAALEQQVKTLSRFKGHLGDSPAALLDALDTIMAADRQLRQLLNYASQVNDQDTRVSASLERLQVTEQLAVQYATATAYVRPELLGLDQKVRGFLAAEPKLAPYRPYLDDILRFKPHTLSPEEEQIVAEAGNMATAGDAVHSIFTNADMPYPDVTLSTGEKVRLDAAGYTKYRAATSRADREKVFKAFWTAYQDYRRTLGTTLYSAVKSHLFYRNVHHFGSSLEAALFTYNIPPTVYTQLLADVHANLPTLHRYLKLRQRILGLDHLTYEDLYAPLVKSANLTYTPEQAIELVVAAVAPLGKDYQNVLQRSFRERWVDFLPSTGKRSGAYSNSTYGVHPYQLQNFMGQYDDVSTLAHESGHSMHSFLADQAQPYVTHDYSIFVAEVASTLNENLLLHYMLDRAKDDDTRLFLLGTYLDGLRQTLFRQTLFAEFELRMHELAEKGESLTGDNLNALYLQLARTYYGHDQGVCKVDDLYSVEWAYIPHFYANFYVYQYATSLVASTSIANAIREEAAAPKPSTKARDAYLAMLAGGSSKYPIDLLKGAGVDMTTPAPFSAAMKEMNRVMDEIDHILDARKK